MAGPGSALHLLDDLKYAAELLASVGRDTEAFEVLGLADGQAMEVLGPHADANATRSHMDGLDAAEQRLGAAGGELEQRGLSVLPGMRATRGSQLLRSCLEHVPSRAPGPRIAGADSRRGPATGREARAS